MDNGNDFDKFIFHKLDSMVMEDVLVLIPLSFR